MASFPLIDWIVVWLIFVAGLAGMCGLAWWLNRSADLEYERDRRAAREPPPVAARD